MMRRTAFLTGLAAILGWVTVTNAALWLSVDGQIDPQPSIVLTPGNTAVLGIHGDGLTASPVVLYLLVQGPGTIHGHRIAYPGNLSDYFEAEEVPDRIPHAPGEPAIPIGELGDEFPGLQDISLIILADPFDPYPPLKGLLVDDIIFSCEGIGDVKLTLVSNGLMNTYDTRPIHQIPEPGTIVLFAMGVFFLCRRT